MEEDLESGQVETLIHAFREQLIACLEECVAGRRGLFSDHEHLGVCRS